MNTLKTVIGEFEVYGKDKCKSILTDVGNITVLLASKASFALGIYFAFVAWRAETSKDKGAGKVGFLKSVGVDIPSGKKGESTKEYDAFRHLYRTARTQLKKQLYDLWSTTVDDKIKADCELMAKQHDLTLTVPKTKSGEATPKGEAGKSTSQSEENGELPQGKPSPITVDDPALGIVFDLCDACMGLTPAEIQDFLEGRTHTLANVKAFVALYAEWYAKQHPQSAASAETIAEDSAA